MLFSIISLSLAGVYFFIVFTYQKGWHALENWEIPTGYTPQTKVTVIVPARNEEKKIIECLTSIVTTEYPSNLLEVIVVDDHSTDQTAQLVKDFSVKHPNVRLLPLADFTRNRKINSYKKLAIKTAISLSEGELIVTTDADCVVPVDWLQLMVSFYELKKVCFIAAPVNLYRESSAFEKFQSLDFLGLMGVTGAGIRLGWMNMCNGANLAYAKSAFEKINGFEGIDFMASGDDIFLMQKMAAYFPDKIGFLKNKKATVFTLAKPDVKSFFAQRLRWATKSGNYQEWKITTVLVVVFFYCCAIVFSLFAAFSSIKWAILFVVLLTVKSLVDYIFLREMAVYFNRTDLLQKYWAAQVLHIIYIVTIGTVSNLKKQYDWKGRSVR